MIATAMEAFTQIFMELAHVKIVNANLKLKIYLMKIMVA
jgi:hypothetical protein